MNFGSRAEYNEQRRLQASIDSMGLSASSLLQKVNLPRSPYEPSFADIPTGESKIRVRDTGGNDDSSTNRPAQDERGIEEKRGDDSKAAAASAAAAAQDTSAAADGNIVDMYKVVALVIGSRGVHPGPRSRTSRLLSIYDGITEYMMHQWCEAPSDSPGYFVHKSKADALRTAFPRGSKLLNMPRCLLRCRVRSSEVTSSTKYGETTLTTTRLRPVEMWEIDLVYPSPRANGLPPYWDLIHWRPSGIFK